MEHWLDLGLYLTPEQVRRLFDGKADQEAAVADAEAASEPAGPVFQMKLRPWPVRLFRHYVEYRRIGFWPLGALTRAWQIMKVGSHWDNADQAPSGREG